MDAGTEMLLLERLFENGAMTEQQLSAAVEAAGASVDRSPTYIPEWCENAAKRGLIEATAGSGAVRRWNITDDGRRQIGNDPGR